MAVGLAVRAFFAVLFNRQAAQKVRTALLPAPDPNDTVRLAEQKGAAASLAAPVREVAQSTKTPPPASQPVARRSDAITLLSTLQREARLIDLVMEPLDGFEDAQIGAAAREVLRDSQKVLARLLAIKPLSSEEEGSQLRLPDSPSPARFRIVGSGASSATAGTITHRGWQATKCDLPKWTGSTADAQLLAPIEVEIE